MTGSAGGFSEVSVWLRSVCRCPELQQREPSVEPYARVAVIGHAIKDPSRSFAGTVHTCFINPQPSSDPSTGEANGTEFAVPTRGKSALKKCAALHRYTVSLQGRS
jgi:hypothetical protein